MKIIKEMKEEYNILFIGNSYTYFNESWNIFKEIANKQSIKVNVNEVTSGGYTLEKMSDSFDPYGKKVYEYLSKNKYDVVILQEQSVRPIIDKEKFFEAVRKLYKLIIKNGATPLLYETWGRKDESPDLQKFNLTNESMTNKLIISYNEIAKELNINVSHVGTIFYKIYSEYKDTINIYHPDGSHPSELGSYIIALTHFTKIFNFSPIGINYKYFKNNEKEQKIIEEIIHKICFNE